MKKSIDYIGVGVGVTIFNDQGEIFLARRSQKSRNEKGLWQQPGGGVEWGETLKNAAIRETQEEFGIDIEIAGNLPTIDHILPIEKQHWVAVEFLAKIKNGQTPQIQEPDKFDALGWFSLDNLPSPLSSTTQNNLRVILESLHSKDRAQI